MAKFNDQEMLVKLYSESIIDRRNRHQKTIVFLEHILQTDWFKNCPPHIQILYKDFPPWGFYTYKNDQSVPIRHFGVIEDQDKYYLDAIVNDTKVKIDINDVIKINEWNDLQLENIKQSLYPGTMMEPIAFVIGANTLECPFNL